MNIFFLSVHSENVELILQKFKLWEFRRNLNFGIIQNHALLSGDFIFLVSTFLQQDTTPEIKCLCKVTDILRGDQILQYFGKYDAMHWQEAACQDNTYRNWEFFRNNILSQYSTAVKLLSTEINPPIYVDTIKHKIKEISWRGIGFTPLDELNKYTINDEPITNYFKEIVEVFKKVLK